MLKSLEVINAKIESLKQQRENRIEEFKLFNDDDAGEEIILLDSQISELKQIKQSLEVLEILINYIYSDNEGALDFSFLDDLQYDQKKYGVVYNYIACHKAGDNHDE